MRKNQKKQPRPQKIPLPGASSRGNAQHAYTRPTARRKHTQTPSLHLDERELRLEAPEDRTPHLRGARPHDGAHTVNVHPCPFSNDRLPHLRREELIKANGASMFLSLEKKS